MLSRNVYRQLSLTFKSPEFHRAFSTSGAAAASTQSPPSSAATNAYTPNRSPVPKIPQQGQLKQSSQTPQRSSLNINSEYDVFIVGGGITGSALLYQLATFTDIKRIGLVERREDFATVASGPNNNSQTIHCGDIETNYTYEKAKSVKLQADMLRNYGSKLPEDLQSKTIYKMQKMVIGVGEDECYDLEQRFNKFKELFPHMQFVSKTQLRSLEPNVVRISNHRDRHDLINAIVVRDEHSAVNYYHLTNCFIQQAQEVTMNTSKTVDVKTNVEVKNITVNEDESYTLHTTRGNVRSKFVVVSSCGYSLLFAQKLGYGLKYGCLPVSGSFYFSKVPVLNGKVYTVQTPNLPFAAVHGDPDIHSKGMTRFGPTASPLPLLERYNPSSFKDFVKVSRFDLKYVWTLMRLFRDPIMVSFALRNMLFNVPYFGLNAFVTDARKIIPGMSREDIFYANGYGGIRPQLLDKKTSTIILGEGKIKGNNIIFNITPSPGGTTCLGNGELDMRSICKVLKANINEDKFRKTLLEGEYTIDYL